MRLSGWTLLIVVYAVALEGCSSEYKVAPIPPKAESTDALPAAGETLAQPNETAVGQVSPPADSPAAAVPPVASPSAPSGPPIRLSAGVALPQNLPSGTAMGFSVDYRYVQGGPEAGSRYVWVIQGNQPDPFRQDVQLQQDGTLQTFVPPWRPEHGPFQCHIEDGHGKRLSDSAPLR